MSVKVLVVDDEKDILTLLEYNLEKAGFRVVSTGDGPEALEKAGREAPDLIILDIMLPNMDGTDVCRELKSSDATRDIPVIMLTAKGEEIDRIVGFELGADDYITKPFSPRELILRVKAILKRRNRRASARRAGPISLDMAGRAAAVYGRPLRLTPIEFKLLAELIMAGGRVLSRDTLLDMVWGTECYITDRTVDTHIRRLRKKLGESGRYIETVRGFGYRLRVEE